MKYKLLDQSEGYVIYYGPYDIRWRGSDNVFDVYKKQDENDFFTTYVKTELFGPSSRELLKIIDPEITDQDFIDMDNKWRKKVGLPAVNNIDGDNYEKQS